MNAIETSPATITPQSSLLPAWFLALGTFAIGTEGYMIAPLLPHIAADLHMSLAATATLVIVFTLVLALSSPVLTVATSRVRRRDLLILAMALFTAGNLIAAWATDFRTLMLARILMAAAAGLYTPNANALTGVIVSQDMRGRALAVVSGGMTLAIAFGLPLGAVVGHAFGWRSTFLLVAAMGILAVAGIFLGIDRQAGAGLPIASLSQRLSVFRQAAVRRLLLVTLFWSMGAYIAYPFIAPYLIETLHFGDITVSATVTLWGVSAAIGVFTGGALNDRFGSYQVTRATLIILALSFLLLTAAFLPITSLAVTLTLAGVAFWGFSVWGFFPAQMARLMAAAGSTQAGLALSLNTSTMYLGFSIGSALGSQLLAPGTIWLIAVFAALFEAAALAFRT